MTEPVNWDTIAHMAYNGYYNVTGGQSPTGEPLLPWAELQPTTQDIFKTAVQAVDNE